ncbi:tyrosine-type recombinase/integrase [Cytobacillus pseudoceanisediminis]|uniref:tyrosine-type recombinase/integrase n=1 Tax=Cytobacillus pseudoceanisediminis TaxID=3051614 RepID=UPI002188E8EE|nr:tyrosine-type recombinase/integrase [Cytobacillus pseudoceanisediminis]UQX52298.1 tyrosine-type recombinase/integrase [Cytobacillus pseudoceanisediminis]
MNFVQPIRDPDMILYMKKFLKEQSDRNYMLFVTGINSGLRISDILQLRVRDVKKSYFNIIEIKTKKKKRIDMTTQLQREFKWYIEGKEDHEFLFRSRKGLNRPISRSMAYKILRHAADYVGLDDIGTHTMRKTFGYHLYKKTGDVALLQKILNHSDPAFTLRYIGISDDMMNQAIKSFKI